MGIAEIQAEIGGCKVMEDDGEEELRIKPQRVAVSREESEDEATCKDENEEEGGINK